MQIKKSYTYDWELIPNQGLGKIHFGLNISQVNALDHILGKLTPVHSPSGSSAETYELLKGIVPDEDLKELMKLMNDVNSTESTHRQEFRSGEGLMLTFEDELLMDFFANDQAGNLHFQGIPVFSSDPLYLVKQMVSVLSENPIAKNEELVFPKNHIYLFDFLNEDGTRAASKERTITWRNTPRILSVSLHDYKELNILNKL